MITQKAGFVRGLAANLHQYRLTPDHTAGTYLQDLQKFCMLRVFYVMQLADPADSSPNPPPEEDWRLATVPETNPALRS